MTTIARSELIADQELMGHIWYENLVNSGVDLETYMVGRRAAYNERWREAGRFIRPGSRVLDIGGGHLYEELLRYIDSKAWDYWYLEMGEAELAHSRKLAVSMGFNGEQFLYGFNHELHFEPNSFDAVFSSHCIEHSMDLKLTLVQLNAILKPGGNLLMAVPFGWERNPGHPFFFLENEWMALVQDAGFRLRVCQIGWEYPEKGCDLFIAARKVAAPVARPRIDPESFRKTNYEFHDFKSPSVRYFGDHVVMDEYILMQDSDWRIEIAPTSEWREILPLFLRHDWSGVVRCQANGQAAYEDLYRLEKVAQPMRLRLSAPASAGQTAEIAPVGRNEASYGQQAAFVGYMLR
jgi:SAM-dependent methyltransferase